MVDEQRVYAAWSESNTQRGEVNRKSGIIECKNLLNKLHFELGASGFNQVSKHELCSFIQIYCLEIKTFL